MQAVGRRKSRIIIPLFLLPALAIYVTFFIYPAIDAFRIALYDWSGFGNNPTYVGLGNFQEAFRDKFVRVALTTVLGYFTALYVPPMLGLEIQWGTVGLTLTAGIAGWIEFILLRYSLNKKIGKTGLPVIFTAKLWTAAALGAAVGWAVKLAVGHFLHPIIVALLVTVPYGVTYFLAASAFKVTEAQVIVKRAMRLIPGLK